MVALGYPGEIQEDLSVRWFWWCLSMIPFCYVVFTLAVGLAEATSKQPSPAAASLASAARYLTVLSWCTYPFVYMVKSVGLAGPAATMYEQVGYSLADVLAKAVFGVLIWAIAAEKSAVEESELSLGCSLLVKRLYRFQCAKHQGRASILISAPRQSLLSLLVT
ncbi:unnamed protein product [Polarella glacialis]|nr:unnamed protein product [Polarella glacialis]